MKLVLKILSIATTVGVAVGVILYTPRPRRR